MLTLVPAYGRDYKNKKDVKEDWYNEKDFIVADMSSPYDGKPVNMFDLRGIHKEVMIRYDNLRKIIVCVV